MKKNVYLYRVSSWLKHQLTARNTGGHGVHSPYLFEWVRMVMSDKNTYYVWDTLYGVEYVVPRSVFQNDTTKKPSQVLPYPKINPSPYCRYNLSPLSGVKYIDK